MMKQLIYLTTFALFCSCAGETQDEEQVDPEGSKAETPLNTTDSLIVEDTHDGEIEILLEDFPPQWILLTDVDDNGENLVINKWCEAETENFYFVPQKGENWQIHLAYGQDGEICEVAAFEAYEKETEGMQVVSGNFEFKAAYDESMRFVAFWWNKDERIGHFEGLGMRSAWFVPEEDSQNYETIEEDCEGLWE